MKKPQREDTFVRLAAAVHRAAPKGAPDEPVPDDETDDVRPGHDQGVQGAGPSVAGPGDALLYDSASEVRPFSGWILHTASGSAASHFRPHPGTSSDTYTIKAAGTEDVGINKSLPVLSGSVAFDYQVVEPRTGAWHIYFAMIPMRESQRGLLEVGGEVPVDPRNARSPYRLRMFVPGQHYGDGLWHVGRMLFNFEGLPAATYSIFAPRINEGVEEPGAAILLIRNVRAWAA
jgi:hypothetical protein